MGFINALPGAVAQGLIWGLMAIGLYVSYKILDIADLTVDGSICTGACVCAVLLTNGVNVFVCLLLAFLAGALAGVVTGLFHTAMGIPAILAGILTQLILWSLNLKILGKANLSISARNHFVLLSSLNNPLAIAVALLCCVVVILLLFLFFYTEIGLSVKSTGDNADMSEAQGVNVKFNKVLGLAISNGIVALAGALLAQYQGFADINMGRGAIVIGLAAIIIGLSISMKIKPNFVVSLIGVVGGGIAYYLVYTFVIWLGLDTDLLKMLSALVVALFLGGPYLKRTYFTKPKIPTECLTAAESEGDADALKITNLYKTFNPGTVNEKRALSGLNLHLREGDFVTVIGGNGAGKSTMLNAISGVWRPDYGTITIDGVDVTGMPAYKRAAFLCRVFQDPMKGTAPDMEIAENLAIAARRGKRRRLVWGCTHHERQAYRDLLAQLDLGLEDRLSTKVGLLSGGQRQAVTLLMATLKNPKLLLLDEHTAALDPKTAAKVLAITDRLVTENHLTTLMVTHNMYDAIKYGNRLIMLYEGNVVVDIAGEQKKNLTVEDLLALFEAGSGSKFASDKELLSK